MAAHLEVVHQCDHINNILTTADRRWKSLEERLSHVEGEFLHRRQAAWKQWFHIEEEDLDNDFEGGVRSVIRERVNALVIAPLYSRMHQRLSLAELPVDPAVAHVRSALAVILEDWHGRVKPVIVEAKEADADLDKQIRKTERDERKQGVVALGMQDTKRVAYLKRQRPAIWDKPREVLEKYAPAARRVAAYLEDELSDETVDRLVESVPLVVCRTVCDWNYQKCLFDLDQLHRWWTATKHLLESNEQVWARLWEKEGIHLRRLEPSMEDISQRQHGYSAYATFGGSSQELMRCLTPTGAERVADGDLSPKAEESLAALAGVVSDMVRRLRVVRYSAMWRVVDTAKDIAKEIADETGAVIHPWEAVGPEEGTAALFQSMGIDSTSADRDQEHWLDYGDEDALTDAACAVMPRLTSLGAAAEEVREFFSSSAGVNGVLKHLADAVAEYNEDLLGLIDEPTPQAARAWLDNWRRLGAQGLGERMDVAMSALDLRQDADLHPESCRARRHWLALGRGLQLLMDDRDLWNWLVAPLASSEDSLGGQSPHSPPPTKAAERPPAAQTSDALLHELAVPASPRVLPSSPMGILPCRSQPHRSPEDSQPEGRDAAEPTSLSAPSPLPAASDERAPNELGLATEPASPATVLSPSPSIELLNDEPEVAPPPSAFAFRPESRDAAAAAPPAALESRVSSASSLGDVARPARFSPHGVDSKPGSPGARAAVGSRFVDGGQVVAPRPSTPGMKLSPIAPSSRARPSGGPRASSSLSQSSAPRAQPASAPSRAESSSSRAQNSTSRAQGSTSRAQNSTSRSTPSPPPPRVHSSASRTRGSRR